MKQNTTTPIDSFPAMLSRPISICNAKTLYTMQVLHLDGYFCQLSIYEYNTNNLIIDMIQHIDYIDELVLSVDNIKNTTILFGK